MSSIEDHPPKTIVIIPPKNDEDELHDVENQSNHTPSTIIDDAPPIIKTNNTPPSPSIKKNNAPSPSNDTLPTAAHQDDELSLYTYSPQPPRSKHCTFCNRSRWTTLVVLSTIVIIFLASGGAVGGAMSQNSSGSTEAAEDKLGKEASPTDAGGKTGQIEEVKKEEDTTSKNEDKKDKNEVDKAEKEEKGDKEKKKDDDKKKKKGD